MNDTFKTIQVRPKSHRTISLDSARLGKKIYEYIDILIKNRRELNRLKKQPHDKAKTLRRF